MREQRPVEAVDGPSPKHDVAAPRAIIGAQSLCSADVAPLVRAAAESGVLLSGGDDGRIRAVTHYGLTAEDVDAALAVIERTPRPASA